MKKKLNLILNGKGGVGKSFFAANFVQFLKDNHIDHAALDTDNENSTLKRFHPESRFIDINNVRELDELFAAIEGSALVVADCRAASTEVFLSYFAELKVFDVLESMGASLSVISPVNHDLDSVEQIKMIANAFDDHCEYLVVKNQALTEQFTIYDSSKTRTRLVDELGAKEIMMPKLQDWVVGMIHQLNLPVGQAVQHPKFSLMDRQRLKNWQRRFSEQIETVRDVVLPS